MGYGVLLEFGKVVYLNFCAYSLNTRDRKKKDKKTIFR